MEFSGRTAIITGGASGMGLLTGQELAKQGANVVLCDVNAEAVENCAAEIRRNGGNAIGVKVDVRDYNDICAARDLALSTYGSIDILLNSAGGASCRVLQAQGNFADWDVSVIQWGIDVNLKGPLMFCHAVIRTMIEQKRGVIINMGSIDGVTGSFCPDYSAAKAGMIGLTKSMALIGAPHGVRACCVSPGPVLTRAALANMKTRLGRAAEPIEVVNLILYLCSDKAAFITGSNHLIDGGRNCGSGCA